MEYGKRGLGYRSTQHSNQSQAFEKGKHPIKTRHFHLHTTGHRSSCFRQNVVRERSRFSIVLMSWPSMHSGPAEPNRPAPPPKAKRTKKKKAGSDEEEDDDDKGEGSSKGKAKEKPAIPATGTRQNILFVRHLVLSATDILAVAAKTS
jgi:hypothetical protein